MPDNREMLRAAKTVMDILRNGSNAALWLRRVSETETARLIVLPECSTAPLPYVCLRKWFWHPHPRPTTYVIRANMEMVVGTAVGA